LIFCSKNCIFCNFQFILCCKASIYSQDCGKSRKHCELHVAQNWTSWTNDCKISRRRLE